MANKRNINCDILIIGAGIAGSALACALKDSGLSVIVIEKNDGPLDTARGDHLKPHTCELLEKWGVLNELFARGAQKRFITKWQQPAAEPFYIEDYATLNTPHPYFAYLSHEKIGEVLLSSAAAADNVTVIKPCHHWNLDNDYSEKLAITVETAKDTLNIKPKVLIGADGRSSKVRQIFDFETEIKTYNKPLVVLIGEPDNSILSNELTVNVCKDRLITLIPRGQRNCKVAIPESRSQVKNWSKASEKNLQELLLTFLPEATFKSLRYVDIYSPVDLQTTHWVKNDNVALIGDSCHALHPARSEGMNLCIYNAHKLAKELSIAPNELGFALKRYEKENLSRTISLIEENRVHATTMDSDDEDTYTRLISHMAALKNDPSKAKQRLTSTAGY